MPSQSVEAATRDEAIAAAREKFGPTARVVGVRRIRSGGMFGFFANERYIAEVEVAKPAPVGGPDSGSLLKVGPREQRPEPSMDDRMRELADLLGAAQEQAPAGLYGRSGTAAPAATPGTARPRAAAAGHLAGLVADDRPSPRAAAAPARSAAPSGRFGAAVADRFGAPASVPSPARVGAATGGRPAGSGGRAAAAPQRAAATPFTPSRHTLMLPPDELDPVVPEQAEPVAEQPARPSPFAAALTRMVASSPVQAAAEAAADAAAAEALATETAAADAAAAQAAAVEAAAAEKARAAAARIDAAAAEAARLRAEAAAAEAARLKAAAAAAEAARVEAEAAAAEAARLEAEAAAAEAERVEAERVEAARLEAARLEAARLEAERLEAARLEAERLEAERVEAARLEAERLEAERLEAARVEAARVEAARGEAARLEAERLEAARLEAERLEAERVEAARLEAARLEAARLEAARLEAERLEAARLEAERLEAERVEAARLEAARIEAARLEAARLEAERVEAARIEAERLEAEAAEAARVAGERIQAAAVAEVERLRAAAQARESAPLSMVESVRSADEELAALLEEILAANGSGRGRHRLPDSLVTAAVGAEAAAVAETVVPAAAPEAEERVLDVPEPWAYDTRAAEPSAYDTGSYRTDAAAWASDARVAQRAAQVAAAQDLVVDAVVVDETPDVRPLGSRPVEVPVAVPVADDFFAVPVSLAPTMARTASDPAPLPMDATMVLPPLSLMPPQRFGGALPPALSGRPAVPPVRRGRPPVPAPRQALTGRTPVATRPVPITSRSAAGALPAATEERPGNRLATVTRLVPATSSTALAPLTMSGSEELVLRLLTLGLPDFLLGADFTADAAARGVYAALTRTLAERLPEAPRLPTAPGDVLMVVGPGAETFAAARSLAVSLRLAPEDVQWAASGALAGLAPEASRITTLETAAERQLVSTTTGAVTVVAVDAPLRTAGGPWLEHMLAVWSPTVVWAVLDATRKPEDLVPWLEALPRLDAVVVQDSDATADPAAVLTHVPVPVAMVDGARATAHRWASLLCERLEEMDA